MNVPVLSMSEKIRVFDLICSSRSETIIFSTSIIWKTPIEQVWKEKENNFQ